MYAVEEEAKEKPVSAGEFWRRYKAGERDFSGINLAGVNLSKSTLADGVNLSKANLSNSNLIQVKWNKVNLIDVNLTTHRRDYARWHNSRLGILQTNL